MTARGTIIEAIEQIVRAELGVTRVMLPCSVLEYNGLDEVTVQPTIKLRRRSASGALVSFTPTPIPRTPVVWPGGGSYALTFPLSEGDTGLLVFADRSLDDWLLGAVDVEPKVRRQHDYADAVFIPGLRQLGAIDSNLVDSSALVVGVPGSGEVKLGSAAATSLIALADKVLSRINAIELAFNTHVHATAATGPPVPPSPAAGIPISTTSLSDLASARVRSE